MGKYYLSEILDLKKALDRNRGQIWTPAERNERKWQLSLSLSPVVPVMLGLPIFGLELMNHVPVASEVPLKL